MRYLLMSWTIQTTKLTAMAAYTIAIIRDSVWYSHINALTVHRKTTATLEQAVAEGVVGYLSRPGR